LSEWCAFVQVLNQTAVMENGMKYICVLIIMVLAAAGHTQFRQAQIVKPKIIKRINHDPNAFTQGLELYNGRIIESTGLYGMSSLRLLDTNGAVVKKVSVDSVFAEGCTVFKGNLYQLTWRESTCFVYSPSDFKLKKKVFYSGEGWGLAHDKAMICMSNGSDTIYFRDSSFVVKRKLQIQLNGQPLRNLNELECANGKIYANIWYENAIAEIDPGNGMVMRLVDCSEIVASERPASQECVLNGIAYRESDSLFYITGKKWAHIYLVKF
jgi:glutamine cyclotransferase